MIIPDRDHQSYLTMWFFPLIMTLLAAVAQRVEPVFCYLTVTGLKPLVLMSTCPWARCWTPNCSWHLVNQPPPSVYEWINYYKLLWMRASAKCYCADLILSRFIVKTKNLLKHLKHIFSIINQPMRCTEQQDYQNKNGLHINVRIWSDRVTQLF